ncbi:MAG: hypothetical protein ABI461_16270 [Polyangiaceae bacterium]
MTSALEASITLEEVFGVLTSKRVPLAPELAGYLALELAEGAGSMPGELQPKQIYIGDEGTVAIVRRPSQNDASVDSVAPTARGAEASIRAILQRLLDASGSQTPALSTVAKKVATVGVPALMQELEAALIPVNRAAGRRALARLAREAKRVTLGVGRNAAPAGRASSPSMSQIKSEAAKAEEPAKLEESTRPPASSNFSKEEVPTTAKRDVPLEVLSAQADPPGEKSSLPPTTRAATGGLQITSPGVALQRPASVNELPTVELSRSGLASPNPRDSVDSLLSSFEVSDGQEKSVSRDLKAIAGLEPTPPPPDRHQDPGDSSLDSLLAMTDSVRPGPSSRKASLPSLPPISVPPPRRVSSDPPPIRKAAPSFADERSMQTEPKVHRSASSPPKAKGRGIDRVLIVLFFVLLAGGAVMVWMLKPGFFTGRTPEKVEEERRAAEAASAKAADLAAKSHLCKQSLGLTDVPPKAEVLLRVGQAPVDIEHVPMAVRLELVATLDNYATKRAVILPDATWDKGADGKPRLETALQLDPIAKHHGKASPDTWPLAEPGSDVGGKGDPGTLHIISSPKGAEVWMVAGGGPEAQIDEIPCGDVDVLLGGPGTYRKKIHVRAADFAAGEPAPNGDTIKIAHVSAK